jgi:hypothetical protein
VRRERMKIIIDTKKLLIREKLTRAERKLPQKDLERELELDKLKGLSAAVAGAAYRHFKSLNGRYGWCDLVAMDAKARLAKMQEEDDDGNDNGDQ